jgi:hypothetical protein
VRSRFSGRIGGSLALTVALSCLEAHLQQLEKQMASTSKAGEEDTQPIVDSAHHAATVLAIFKAYHLAGCLIE